MPFSTRREPHRTARWPYSSRAGRQRTPVMMPVTLTVMASAAQETRDHPQACPPWLLTAAIASWQLAAGRFDHQPVTHSMAPTSWLMMSSSSVRLGAAAPMPASCPPLMRRRAGARHSGNSANAATHAWANRASRCPALARPKCSATCCHSRNWGSGYCDRTEMRRTIATSRRLPLERNRAYSHLSGQGAAVRPANSSGVYSPPHVTDRGRGSCFVFLGHIALRYESVPLCINGSMLWSCRAGRSGMLS